jgi:DNA-binding response OmpR family regulator
MHFIQQCFEETGESFDRLKNVLNEGYYWSTGTANADFQLGHLSLFTGISQANYLDKLVELGPGQFRIVEILAKNHGKPISRENMYLAYRNIATVDNGPKTMDGVINTQIKLIRKAFKKIDDQFDLIRSVTGAGYYWKSPSES